MTASDTHFRINPLMNFDLRAARSEQMGGQLFFADMFQAAFAGFESGGAEIEAARTSSARQIAGQ